MLNKKKLVISLMCLSMMPFISFAEISLNSGSALNSGTRLNSASASGRVKSKNPYETVDESPKTVVTSYLHAMKNGNNDPNLPIFTKASKIMMQKWSVSRGQMRNISSSYNKCDIDAVLVKGNYAVVRYPVKQRKCSPFFMQKEGNDWKLDLTVMMKGIKFDTQDAWRLDQGKLNPNYKFAFSDWNFDRNGNPLP